MEMLPPLILEMRTRFGEVYKESAKVDAAVKKTAGEAEASQARSSAAFKKTSAVGKAAFLGLGVGALAVGYESVKMASKFQSSMTLLQTAAGESSKNMKTVSNGVLSIATATGTSVEQLSEGMYTVEKAGIRGAAGLKVLKAAAEGAKAENVDLGTATNALTSIMMSYHLSADKAVSAENMLIAGSGLAKTSMQSYAGALSTVIPVASAAGISFQQVGGAIATLTQHGTSAEEATQELANTIRGLQAPNMVASKMMQQLGINVTDLTSHLGQRGLTGTIDIVTSAIARHEKGGMVALGTWKRQQSAIADLNTMVGHMTGDLAKNSAELLAGKIPLKSYTKAAGELPATQQVMARQFATLFRQSHGFSDALKSGQPQVTTFAGALNKVMGGATGMNTALMLGGENLAYFNKATAEVGAAGAKTGKDVSSWAMTQKNLSVQLAQAKQAVDVLGIRIGTVLIPWVSKALRGVAAFIGVLRDHKTIALALGGVIGGFLVLAMMAWISTVVTAQAKSVWAFLKMTAAGTKWAISTAANLARLIAQGAVWVASNIAQAATVVAANIASATATAAAWVAANATMLLAGGGILLLLAGLAFGAYELYKHWSTVWSGVKRIVGDAVTWVRHHLTLVLTLLLGPMGIAIGAIIKHWKGFSQGVIAAVRAVWAVIHPIFEAIVKVGLWYLRAHIIVLRDVWHAAWTAVSAVVRTVWAVLRPILSAIVTAGLWYIRTSIMVFRDVWTTTWNVITRTVQAAYNFLATVFGWFDKYLFRPLEKAAQGLYNFWATIFGWIGDAVQACWNFIKPIVDAISHAVGGVAGAVGKIAGVAGKVGKFLGFEDGGIVPGAKGAPMLAVVHGGEYVVSNAMQAGQKPIDNHIMKVPFSNVGGGGAVVGSGLTPGAAPAPSGGHGGDVDVIEVHSHTYLDGKQITHTVETQQLRRGGRRSQTYQPFKRQ
jgi:TP901 family phage tail tape measure protein